MTTGTTGQEARDLLRRHNFGVLSTISVEMPGYPFGSVTPYAIDRRGEPVILISAIAQHTRNITRDRRVSLTALDANAREQQAASRLTLVADAVPVDEPDELTRGVYLSHFPDAAGYFDFHDFSLYRLEVRRARFIGGFGKIHWVERADLIAENPLAAAEPGVLAHMNEDHAESLAAYCRAFLGVAPRSVVMSGIDAEGFDMLADGAHARVAFERPVATPEDARAALVALVRRARQETEGRP
jgi:putative heme iron utilization protein